MIRGPILRVVASVTFPFTILLTLYFLVSGHNNPGGGFIAGVLMSGAVAFQFIAHGPEDVPKFLKLPYERIVALGFVIAIAAAAAPLAVGYPFLTSFHATVNVPILGAKMEFALAQLFDFGIFLLVAGGVVTAVLALARDSGDEALDGPSDEQASSVAVEVVDGAEGTAEMDADEGADAEGDAEPAPAPEPVEAAESLASVEGEK